MPPRHVAHTDPTHDTLAGVKRVTFLVQNGATTTQASAAPTNPVTITPGTVQEGTLPSAIMGGARPYMIYLPPNYAHSNQRYPVIYLLHGAPGRYTDWVKAAGIDKTLDAMIAVGRIPPMIAVMPDGNGGLFGDTEWANSADGSVRAEDYVTQEVVPFIDAHYRTLANRDHRALGGLSTGAFGAVNMLLHHPNQFGYALALSGNYLAGHTWTGKDMWAGNAKATAYNSPTLYVQTLAHTDRFHIFLGVGKTDNLDNTLKQTQQFDQALTQMHVPHSTQYYDGAHDWPFWTTHIVDGLDYLDSVMPS